MKRNHEHERACEQYLLGELSEQDQSQLEESYFTDDALFERFLAVKDELIDAYARGDLAGEKRKRFERHFLASQPRQQRVEEARAFIHAVTAAAAKADASSPTVLIRNRNSWWRQLSTANRPWVLRGALAAALLVALAGSWMLVRRVQDHRADGERLQKEQAARREQGVERGSAVAPPVNGRPTTNSSTVSSTSPTPTPPSPDNRSPLKPVDKQPSQPTPAQVATIFLSPFSPRDATAANSLMLGPEARSVRLRLAFTGGGYRRYDVILRTVDGEQVLSRQGLKALSNGAGKSVNITLDPSLFRRQDYIISLNGLTADGKLESIGDYYFRVERTVPPLTSSPNLK